MLQEVEHEAFEPALDRLEQVPQKAIGSSTTLLKTSPPFFNMVMTCSPSGPGELEHALEDELEHLLPAEMAKSLMRPSGGPKIP